ncbi:MAG TPA: metallopeptidase TldD-related protein [Terriglobia bacterium]|nr:metallopeptidase TldD-related protein [Terriglobia bacterium]
MAEHQLEQIAQDLVGRAMQAGATAADATVREGDEFSTTIRLGQIENLKEAASKVLGLRVFLGTRSASSYSSDFSAKSLERLVQRTIEMARVTSEDPANGLPEAGEMGRYPGDLQLYSPDVAELTAEERIAVARRAEQAALSSDPRIKNSEGSGVETATGSKAYANSLGFVGSYRSSITSVTVVPVAQEGQNGNVQMQRDYWYAVGRGAAALRDPESIGKQAAARALRRLGARKISTCRVPVVFDAETARSLVGHVFEAVRGDAIYRNASFLAGKLGERVAGENITVLDDGLRPGGFGSRPFDDEGVAPAVTPVLEAGVLRNYLLNAYTARKLNLRTTGNASRGVAGPPSVGPKNFYLRPGTQSPEDILRSVSNGFYVTELIGFGVNVVTGDYSRGAAGLWVENGELTYPVEEVTIAGSLQEMLNHVAVVGSDLEFRSALASPTLLVEGLTVAGT